MRTLVVSDLHLGGRTGIDLARRRELRGPLLDALAGADRLVLLGDALELRHGPVAEALAASRGFFADAGAVLGAGGEIVLLPGNHDWWLAAGWLERRRGDSRPPPLGVAETFAPRAGEPSARLASYARPATLTLAYPGIWLREDVYATHGHYLDRHTTLPTFERLAAGAMGRVVGPLPCGRAVPDDYEAALAPVYSWIHAVAQSASAQAGAGAHGASARFWRALSAPGSGHRALRRRAAGAAFPLVIAVLNRLGLGPMRPDLSGPELRRAGVLAMAETLQRLGLDPPHAIFGHTHRAGPFAGDDAAEWTTIAGTRLYNTGSWVYERHFLTRTPNESPYWPGVAAVVGDAGPPELRRLLGYRGHGDLAPSAPTGLRPTPAPA